MTTLKKRLVNSLMSIVLLSLGSHAIALPITWSLDNVRFDDGGKAEGFITFEWPTIPNVVVPLDSFSITTSGGNDAVFPTVTYEPASVSIAFFTRNPADPLLPPLGLFLFNLDAPTPFGRGRSLRLAPTLPLDGVINVVPLLTAAELPPPGGLGREECFNCVPSRLITSGVLVPEPTMLALLSLGLAGIGYRRYRSMTSA